MSVRQYLLENGIAFNQEESEQEREVFLPVNYPVYMKERIENCATKSVYLAKLQNVIVIGENSFFIIEKYCLNDKYELQYKNEFNFQTGNCLSYSDTSCKIIVNKTHTFIKQGISLIGEGANNYYHWFFDLMSKIVYINNHPELKNIPLLVDETVKNHETCLKLLQIMDDYSHKIIFLKRNKSYLIGECFYISPNTWSNVYVDSSIQSMSITRHAKSKCVIEAYRERMERHLSNCLSRDNGVGGRLFVTRGKNYSQRLIDESVFAEIASHYGFESYDPMKYTIEEQAIHFKNAEFIIAVEGAALVNLIWCKKDTKVICINPAIRNDYLYSTLSYLVGVKCVYLDAQIVENNRYSLKIEDFRNCLSKMINNEM